jgi:hypothetical protein
MRICISDQIFAHISLVMSLARTSIDFLNYKIDCENNGTDKSRCPQSEPKSNYSCLLSDIKTVL